MLDIATYICLKKEKVSQRLRKEVSFLPKFDNDGLIPVVTTCVNTKEILMLGYMNVEAFKKQSRLKKLTIGVDQESKFGIKEKQVVLFKK